MTSMGSVKMASGLEAATSSMDVPPNGDATSSGPSDARSMRMDRYSSRRM
jgi:hypothetical protein